MNDIEERLVRDIGLVAAELEVTGADLHDARVRIDARATQQSDRGRQWLTAAAAAAVVAVMVGWQAMQGGDGGLSPAGSPSPSPRSGISLTTLDEDFLFQGTVPVVDELVGLWRLDNGRRVLTFTADGRFSVDDAGTLFSDPAMAGTYRLQGDQLTLDATDAGTDCRGKTSTIVLSHLEDPGLLHAVVPGQSDFCPSDWSYPRRQVWEHVLPAHRVFSDLAGDYGNRWDPPPSTRSLAAVWFSPTEDHVLELQPSGYLVVDETLAVVDSGEWSMSEDRSELRLTSGEDSATCRPGDQLVLTSLGMNIEAAEFLKGELTRNDCGGEWDDELWISLAP